jgi:hypothetical protein
MKENGQLCDKGKMWTEWAISDSQNSGHRNKIQNGSKKLEDVSPILYE